MNGRLIFSGAASLALGVMMMAPLGVVAQDVAATFEPATIVVTGADGSDSEYSVNDVGIYLSSTPAYDDVPASTDFSLSLTVLSPIDAALLEWAAQGSDAEMANRDVVIVASVGEGKAARELRYEITGAHITSFSTSHSTYAQSTVSLSLSADTLVIDGVAMN